MGIRKNRNANIFNKASPFSKLRKKIYLNHNCFTILFWFLPYTSTSISHRYIRVSSLLTLPPASYPIPSLQVVTEPQFEFTESYSESPDYTGNIYVSVLLPPFIPLSSPAHVHKSVLYICDSIAALQIGASIPSCQIAYICIKI